MTKRSPILSPFLTSLLIAALGACHSRDFQSLPDGVNSVRVDMGVFSSEWTVTVRNQGGSASDTMFAANDHQRTNIYLTSTHQLVAIEQGGADVFFSLPQDGPPEPLNGNLYGKCDTRSDAWRYVGIIQSGDFIPANEAPECIALLGEGHSPYRKKFQVPHFC